MSSTKLECYVCGETEKELNPCGLNLEPVCFKCAMKSPQTTARAMLHQIHKKNGQPPPTERELANIARIVGGILPLLYFPEENS